MKLCLALDGDTITVAVENRREKGESMSHAHAVFVVLSRYGQR